MRCYGVAVWYDGYLQRGAGRVRRGSVNESALRTVIVYSPAVQAKVIVQADVRLTRTSRDSCSSRALGSVLRGSC